MKMQWHLSWDGCKLEYKYIKNSWNYNRKLRNGHFYHLILCNLEKAKYDKEKRQYIPADEKHIWLQENMKTPHHSALFKRYMFHDVRLGCSYKTARYGVAFKSAADAMDFYFRWCEE